MVSSADRYREYRVVLQYHGRTGACGRGDTPPEFVTIVSATDLDGAQREAAKLVATLQGTLSVVEISPRLPRFDG
jgi:hypothetical protein